MRGACTGAAAATPPRVQESLLSHLRECRELLPSLVELLSDDAIHVFHMNDYPGTPVREKLDDRDRVYPGDGVAPLKSILKSIAGDGKSVALSLELFNRDYWQLDAAEVATTGLRKMQEAAAAAGLA